MPPWGGISTPLTYVISYFLCTSLSVSFQSAPGAKAGATVRTSEYFIFVVAPSLVMRYLDMPLDAYPRRRSVRALITFEHTVSNIPQVNIIH